MLCCFNFNLYSKRLLSCHRSIKEIPKIKDKDQDQDWIIEWVKRIKFENWFLKKKIRIIERLNNSLVIFFFCWILWIAHVCFIKFVSLICVVYLRDFLFFSFTLIPICVLENYFLTLFWEEICCIQHRVPESSLQFSLHAMISLWGNLENTILRCPGRKMKDISCINTESIVSG